MRFKNFTMDLVRLRGCWTDDRTWTISIIQTYLI